MRRALGALGLGAVLVFCAAAFGSPSLYIPGLGLIVLALVALVWVPLAARGARVVRSISRSSFEEGETCPAVVEADGGILPIPGGSLVDPLLDRPIPLGGRRRGRARIRASFERRGRRVLDAPRLLVHDPLRLAFREIRGEPSEILVLPRIEPVRAGTPGGEVAGAAEATRDTTSAAAELELDSLRPYRPGAPASRIHWPTVARTGTMVERRLTADADSRPLVVLDPRRPASPEALDQAVRAAASLCVHLARREGCALLLPGDRRATEIGPDMRAWPALHVRLALVEAGDGVPVPGRLERSGAIFWVVANGGERVPTGLRHAAAAGRYLVAPESSGGARPAFTVAGCAGRALGRAAARAAA